MASAPHRVRPVLVLVLVLGSAACFGQTLRGALYPSEDTLAAVCRAYMGDPVAPPAIREFQIAVHSDDSGRVFSVAVEVRAPIAGLATGCSTNATAGWGRSIEDMLADPWYATDAIEVLIVRLVPDVALAVNHLAALLVRDAEGVEVARLYPDPWRSMAVHDGYQMRYQGDRNLWSAASLFVFDILDPAFRGAVEAGGELFIAWRAGFEAGEWQWPIGFGDCTGSLLDACREFH